MRVSNRYKVLVLFLIAIISSIIYETRMIKANTGYDIEGLVLICCNVFLWWCLIFITTRSDYYVFEPMVFVIFLYYMIFVFEPINNIVLNKVTEFGVNTMGGCIKGTIIFMLSFVWMLIGYYGNFTVRKKRTLYIDQGMKTEPIQDEDERYNKKSLLTYSWVLWSIGVVTFLLYNILIGRSAIYMLSFGLLGQGSLNGRGFDVLVLSIVIYISFYPLMNILIYGKSNILKAVALLITCTALATRGFRNILVVILCAPVLFYYIKRKKTPSIGIIAILLAVFVFIFGFIGTTRGATRTGRIIDLSNYEYSDGLDGILYYFDSYKVFYGAVTQYPRYYEYTHGVQLLYTIIMFVPRFIWPGKPETPIREAIGRSVGPLSASSGSAWPNIGEYYTDLGIIGTFACMFILGYLLRKMKEMYQGGKPSSGRLMLYCLFLPALVTIIAYGYTAGNAPQYLLMALPYLFRPYFVKKRHL